MRPAAPSRILPCMDVLVRFEPRGREIRVPAGTLLLDAARSAGLPVASACDAEGVCGRCGVSILSGAETVSCETQQESTIKERNRIDARLRLACRVKLANDLRVTAPYW
jgi:2Fe-2S ferredoxin